MLFFGFSFKLKPAFALANSPTGPGNAAFVAGQLNNLFFINKKVNITLEGATNLPRHIPDLPNPLLSVGGVAPQTLGSLLSARAQVGFNTLILNGLNRRSQSRITISNGGTFNTAPSIISRRSNSVNTINPAE